MKRTYYRKCEYCGGSLDPGEKCDCPGARRARGEEETEEIRKRARIKTEWKKRKVV